MTLEEMNWLQGITPIIIDNSTVYGIINNHIQQKISCAMDIRLYWVQDWCDQDQFSVKWKPGGTNWGDYFTKRHPPSRHNKTRSIYMANAI